MNETSSLRYLVRHGTMRRIGEFGAAVGVEYRRGDRVIVRSERGTEVGEILCPATAEIVAALKDPIRGEILRAVTDVDRKKLKTIELERDNDFEIAEKLIIQHKLAMQIVDIERIFGGERAIFYFLAEDRVDFRELVKSMAREFHARIELRQIGPRDEAKILADYGDCGKPVCCNTHLAVMPAVTMQMAKLQRGNIDPNKITGRCGRLKCCLRYEQDVYEEHQKELPPVGSRVVTAKGQGRVLAHEILAKRLLVEFEDGRRLPVSVSEVLTRL